MTCVGDLDWIEVAVGIEEEQSSESWSKESLGSKNQDH